MTIDSNIIIGYLAGDRKVTQALQTWTSESRQLFLSTIVESEVLAFSGWKGSEYSSTVAFLEESFTSIPFDRSVARIAAELRRSTKIKLPDAAIAATALYTHTPVVTRNVKDFRKIPGLEIVFLA